MLLVSVHVHPSLMQANCFTLPTKHRRINTYTSDKQTTHNPLLLSVAAAGTMTQLAASHCPDHCSASGRGCPPANTNKQPRQGHPLPAAGLSALDGVLLTIIRLWVKDLPAAGRKDVLRAG
jgi:hypothetical protein